MHGALRAHRQEIEAEIAANEEASGAVARFYSDENFPLPVVEALGVLGHDVLTSLAAGNANAVTPDAEVPCRKTGFCSR